MQTKLLRMLSIDITRIIIGIKCKNGILLGADKLMFSKFMVLGTNRRIYNLEYKIVGVIVSKLPDGREMIKHYRT